MGEDENEIVAHHTELAKMHKHAGREWPRDKWVHVRIEATGKKLERLFALEKKLVADGFEFDTGYAIPNGPRDWELDWSYHGPFPPGWVLRRLKSEGFEFTTEPCKEAKKR